MDIDQLGSLIPGVNFDSLDFETLDVNNPEQLQAFADVIQESNVDLASIAQNFDPRYYIRLYSIGKKYRSVLCWKV